VRGRTRLGSRRGRAKRTALVVILGGFALVGRAASAQQEPSGPTGEAASSVPAATVECLDAALRPADSCPAVAIDLSVTADGGAIVVEVANASDASW